MYNEALVYACIQIFLQSIGPNGAVAKSSANWLGRYWDHVSVMPPTQS